MIVEKEKLYIFILKIFSLIILIFIACKMGIIAGSSSGFSAAFTVPIFMFFLLLIGFVIWSLFGEQISAPIGSFLLQSGGKISKTTYYSKARSLAMRNKFEEAIEIYRKILNEDKNDITAYSELGDIYYENLKDYSAAFNCYDKIEKYAQENTDIIFAINRKVDIYLYLSDKNYPSPEPEQARFRAKAVEELEKITKKFPEIKDASRARERINKLKEKIASSN